MLTPDRRYRSFITVTFYVRSILKSSRPISLPTSSVLIGLGVLCKKRCIRLIQTLQDRISGDKNYMERKFRKFRKEEQVEIPSKPITQFNWKLHSTKSMFQVVHSVRVYLFYWAVVKPVYNHFILSYVNQINTLNFQLKQQGISNTA